MDVPVRIRYAAIGLGVAIFGTIFFVSRAIVHVPLGFRSLAVMVVLTVVLTSKVTKYVNADRPVRSVLRAAWNDLNAPRPPKPGQTVVPASPLPARSAPTSAPIEGELPR